MEAFKKKVVEATEFVQGRISEPPLAGLLIGTGLGNSIKDMDEVTSLDYEEIPHFAVSTAPTHHGRLLSGRISGKSVVALQGRFHFYEGYSMKEVTLPVRVMQLLGVKTLVMCNAAGGINSHFNVDDIMVITDHINLTGNNPLVGPNVEEWGPRFPDMSEVYDRRLMALAEKAATENGIQVQRGVYVGLAGPSLETPAEIRFLKTIGADAVGLSTIPEVIAAVHGGMAVLGFSAITNMALPDLAIQSSIEEIIDSAERTAPRLQSIIKGVMDRLPD